MARSSALLVDYPLLIPYQIDFHTTTTGKHISLTKRHVRWKFGFVHLPSLLSGEAGVSCRGLELEIHLVWSIASGKYVLYLNNIPLSQNVIASRLVSRFEHSFTLPEKIFPGNHQVFLKAFATTVGLPVGQAQFEMQFDGQRYNSFYRIFEIGGARMLSTYGKSLDQLVEKGLKGTPNQGGDKLGNVAFMKAITAKHSQNTNDVYAGNGGQSNVDSIVRGRNRYRPAGPSGVSPSVRQTPLVRSPSDPGLFETGGTQAGAAHSNNFYQQHQRHHNQHVGGVPNSTPYQQLQPDLRPRTSPPQFAQPPSQFQGGDSSQRRTANVQPTNNNNPQKIPSASRPIHRTNNTQTHHPTSTHPHANIPPIHEDQNLLDKENPDLLHFSADDNEGLIRSTSSVTLDTLLQTESKSEAASASVMNYSHLDPRQMLHTQKNLSFRLQNPPVYADTVAGDLIQPVYPQYSEPNASFDEYGGGGGGFVGGQNGGVYGTGPAHDGNMPFSPPPFQPAPAPTYETFNAAYMNPPQQQAHYQSQN